MAGLLYRLGSFAARRAWIVIVAWVVILAGAAGAFALGSGKTTDEITIPNTPTQQVQDRLQKILDTDTDKGSGTIVIQGDHRSALTAAQRTEIEQVVDAVSDVRGVDSATDPFATADELAAQQQKLDDGTEQLAAARTQLEQGQSQLDSAIAQAKAAGAYDAAKSQFDAQQAELTKNAALLDDQSEELTQGQTLLRLSKAASSVSDDGSTVIVPVTFDDATADVTDAVKEHVRKAAEDAGVAGASIDFSTDIAPTAEGGSSSEAIGVVIAAIVLFVMLGTLIAAGLPLLNAIAGVGVSYLIVMSLSKIADVSSTTPVLALMLGLAVGIDYTLFILNRHRQQLQRGMEVRESIALANGTSGTAVVFAGATVVIALVALNVTGIPFLGLMGTAGAIAVAVAVLIATTLTPALLSLSGHRVLPKRVWRRIALDGAERPRTPKPMSTPRAWLTAIASVIVLGVVALPMTQMRLGLPDGSSEPHSSTQYRAYEKVNAAFGDGRNAQLVVVADVQDGLSADEMTTEQLAIAERLEDVTSVRSVVPATTSTKDAVAVFQIIPEDGANAASTEQLVHDLRDLTMDDGEVTFDVAGSASGNIDISEYLARALPPYLAIVIGLSLLIMIAVFRSLFVPLVATAGFVLTLFAALGGVTAIFQFGWLGSLFGVESPGPVLSILPTLAVGILFGLAMDYQLFIGTGIREAYAHGASPRVAVQQGLQAGRSVVVAAALIMTAVFAGFVFADSAIIATIGFGLAFGVLLDAFIVRLLLIPALMHLVGKAAWWMPKWLDRIIPDIDVEGAKLERAHPAPPGGRVADADGPAHRA
ncbi:MMPL family transporter [Curtobacterium pusillum]|uniref:MMPL family transporter n=1 Tax=Curtobacterium pusillum TaxID=69373 RepID=UPI00382863F4